MRKDHTFKFGADVIAQAADEEAKYHKARVVFWKREYESAKKIIKKTASVKFREYQVTGGTRFDAYVDYGDESAYNRANEAKGKIEGHQAMVNRFETDARVYVTQGTHEYELSTDDVHYFRLGGEPRED